MGSHGGRSVIFIRFKYDRMLIEETKKHEAGTGTDIKLIQELLGHNDIKTTLRYTHVNPRTLEKIKSPFDALNLKNE